MRSASVRSLPASTFPVMPLLLDRLGVLIGLPLVTLSLNLGQALLLESELLGLGLDLVGASNHVKGELRRVIVLAVHNVAEALNGIRQRHKRAGQTRKHLSHLKGCDVKRS